jgi:hypothetical protein
MAASCQHPAQHAKIACRGHGGCGANRGPQRRVSVAGVEIGPYFVLALDGGLPLYPGSAQAGPILAQQRCPSVYVDTP